MTSKEALNELFVEANRCINAPYKYTTYDLLLFCKQIKEDLKILEILKSNIIDYVVQYGNDHEAYNTATITIQVKTPKEFTEKMIGKEIHYTPCKSISNDDFELLIDMLVKERNNKFYN